MMAAHLIEQNAVRKDLDADAAPRAYGQWLAGWFHADVARLRELYAALRPDGIMAPATDPPTPEAAP